MAMYPTTRPLPAGSLTALLINCPLHGALHLGEGIRVEPTAQRLGFRGELEFIVESATQMGIAFPSDLTSPSDAIRSTAQPAAVLYIPPADVRRPESVVDEQIDKMYSICSALSTITNSSVEPIMIAQGWADRADVTVLHPAQPIAILTSDRDFWRQAVRIASKSLDDPKVNLLLNLYRMSIMVIPNQHETIKLLETRIFHYAQILEIAAKSYGYDRRDNSEEVAIPVRKFLTCLGLAESMTSLASRLDITIRDRDHRSKDGLVVLYWIRNRVAHHGYVRLVDRQQFGHPLVSRPELTRSLEPQYRSLVRRVLLTLPNEALQSDQR